MNNEYTWNISHWTYTTPIINQSEIHQQDQCPRTYVYNIFGVMQVPKLYSFIILNNFKMFIVKKKCLCIQIVIKGTTVPGLLFDTPDVRFVFIRPISWIQSWRAWRTRKKLCQIQTPSIEMWIKLIYMLKLNSELRKSF